MIQRTYPRNIGISIPQRDGVYEILVVGKAQVGAFRDLAELISSRAVSLVGAGTYEMFEHREFVFAGYGDFSGTRCTPEELESDLKSMGFVVQAEVDLPASRTFDRHLFPVMISGSERVIMFRMEPFLRAEKRLEDSIGSGGAAMLYEVGRGYGVEVVERYKELYGSENKERLLEMLRAGARALGWGLFEFRAEDVARIYVRIEQPTVLDALRESRFTYGMVSGLLEGVFGTRYRVGHSSFDRERQLLKLQFVPE